MAYRVRRTLWCYVHSGPPDPGDHLPTRILREELEAHKPDQVQTSAANWISSQSRPDLCVQTSFSQQAFPQPKVKDLLCANQLVHRARQHSDVSVTVRHIPWKDLCVMFHSDAGFGTQSKTQAGYVVAFTDRNLDQDKQAVWSPVAWKSLTSKSGCLDPCWRDASLLCRKRLS